MKDEFAMRLERLRKEKDFTQAEIADRIGIYRGTYNAYEIGKNTPPISVLVRIADIYNVSLDYLLGRTPERRIVGDEIAQRLKTLSAICGDVTPVAYTDLLDIVNALIAYYHTSKRAADLPMADTRRILSALTTVINAASHDSLSTLHQAINDLGITALEANDMITEYIK